MRAGLRPGARPVLLVGAGLVAIVALTVGHLLVGRSDVPAADVLRALTGRGSDPAITVIVLDYRLPRVLVGLGAGALLGIAGLLAQALLRNPLAEPATIGVGGGAALGVVTLLAVSPERQSLVHVAALGGALLVGAAVVVAVEAGAGAVLVGVLLGATASALTALVLVIDSQPTGVLLRWLVGSVNARTDADWTALWPWLLVVGGLAVLLAPWLDLLALGPAMGTGLGLPQRAQMMVGVLAVLATAAAVAAVGAVAFVGLAAPHLTRALLGPVHRGAVVGAAIVGATLLAGADLIAFSVTVALPGDVDAAGVPVGAVTALLGAPLLVALARREIW